MSTLKINNLQALVQAAWSRRKAEVQKNDWQAFRLINDLGDGIGGLTVDYYAGAWHAVLRNSEANYPQILPKLLESLSGELHLDPPMQIFWTKNTLQQKAKAQKQTEEIKIIHERDLQFRIKLGSELHTGLFLDQRDNRQRIRKQAGGKKVLNLFSYTGAFSIAALKGNSAEVHSVDLSRHYLEDLQNNLKLNAVDENKAVNYAQDVFIFLKQQALKQQKFDLIILDPPSFSQSKAVTFSTEKNLAMLVDASLSLLSEKGKMFLSINTQKLRPKDFHEQIKAAIGMRRFKILESLSPPFDFPAQDPKNPHLKACWIGRTI